MRLFVAIDLPEEARRGILNVIDGLRSSDADVRWVDAENIHLTLKFLGEVPGDRVKDVERIISGCVKDMNAFLISLEGIGYFGSPRHVKTIWLGVKEGRESIISLSRSLDRDLSHVRDEVREPRPHITLGRVRSGRNVLGLLENIREMSHVKLCEVDVKEIKLKRSMLGSGGPVYSDVKAFGLGEG